MANAAGIPALKEEKSKSATFGATWTPSPSTSLTADLYRIDIDDRIVLSGRFDAENYPALGATLQTLGVGQAQFFVNSVDTRPAAWTSPPRSACRLGAGRLNTFLAAELQQDRSDRRACAGGTARLRGRAAVGTRAPVHRTGRPAPQGHARLRVQPGQFGSDFRIIHFGPQTLGTFSGPPVPNAHYAAKTSADLSFSWSFSERTRLTVGGTNIFNVKPTPQDPNETDNGFKYESVQFGLNGAAYFARLWHKF